VAAVCAGRETGRPKKNIGQAQLLKNFGLSGDCDAGPAGPQLQLMSLGDFNLQKAELPHLLFGQLGENLVVTLDLAHLSPGTRLRAGDALLELSSASPPLYQAKVILPGIVTEGDTINVE
jgi:TatD DNase family protein